MKTILKWASWLVSAFSLLLMILGSFGYLFGNIQILGVRWGTYYLFAGYFIPLSILLVVLEMSFREKHKE